MHEPLLLSGGKRPADLKSDLQRHHGRHRALAFHEGLDGFTVDELHGVEIVVLLVAEVKDGRHIRVAEGSRRTGLAEEPLAGDVAVQVRAVDDLEGDKTA